MKNVRRIVAIGLAAVMLLGLILVAVPGVRGEEVSSRGNAGERVIPPCCTTAPTDCPLPQPTR